MKTPFKFAVVARALSGAALVVLAGSAMVPASAKELIDTSRMDAVVTTPAIDDATDATDAPDASDAASTECMAKVVHHEAANQPRAGQLAVAQLIVNRMRSGKFPTSVCAVANQRGQFFNTNAYRAPRDTRWQTALDVSRDALSGKSQQVVPGALFYHADYAATPGFMKKRKRLAQVGAHIFYR